MKTSSTLIDQIKKDLKKVLKDKRFKHTLGVVKASVKLAEKYHVDKDSAVIAALLHDYCKNFSDLEYEKFIRMYHIEFDEISQTNKELMHGRIARYIAEDKYNIKDKDILNAIEYHTTGRKNMSLLEMVIALADYIEEGRDFPGVDEIRKISDLDIEKALLKGMDGTIKYLLEEGQSIHTDTIEARNYLIRQIRLKTEVK